MSSKILILFTNSFPYNKGEEFLETEILYLSEKFKRIIIIPQFCEGVLRDIPNNCNVEKIKFEKLVSVKKIFIKYFFVLFKILSYEIIFSKYRYLFIKEFKKNFNTIIWNINCARTLKKEIEKHNLENIILYSYWFTFWGRLLCVINVLSNNGIKFHTRIHGYDYEPTRRKEGFIPFRNFEMYQVYKVFSISKYGIHLLKKEYPFFKNAQLSRLGVKDNGENPISKGNSFHIVSCSSLIDLKRVSLIIDILKNVSISIKWTHFGDGYLYNEIISQANLLPSNIICCFEGYKPNSFIMNFYKNTPVDLFINVSSIEGIPVSIMEAISFGIPCIGCNVGGVSEIVTKETGFLFEKDFDSKDIAYCIDYYSQKSKKERKDFRFGVKQFWNKNYCAHKNYLNFIDSIMIQ